MSVPLLDGSLFEDGREETVAGPWCQQSNVAC